MNAVSTWLSALSFTAMALLPAAQPAAAPAAATAVTDVFQVTGIMLPGQPMAEVTIDLVVGSRLSTTTGQYFRIHVTHAGDGSYDILFGPDPTTTSLSADAYIGQHGSTAFGEIYVEAGVAYLVGEQPYGGTDGGSHSSEGTKSISVVQQRGPNEADPHILLEGTRLRMYNSQGAAIPGAVTTVPSTFFSLNADGTVTTPAAIEIKNLPPTDNLRKMLWQLTSYASAAELARPAPF